MKKFAALMILSGLWLLTVLPVMAQSDSEEGEEFEVQEEMVSVGTRFPGRTATETPAPVDVINSEALATVGATELGKLLQTLAPSFNFSTTFISDGTDGLRPATLRALGPDQTLVLINGKRRHQTAHINVQQTIARGTAGTDINAIPAAAIERIEILRDGAAAQYGSDAIAGVINIVLKDSVDVTDFNLQWGNHYEDDGETLVGGINTGFRVGDGGFFNITAEYRDRGETNRATPATTNLLGWYASNEFTPEVKLRIGDSDSQDLAIFINSEIPSGDATFYLFGGYSDRESDSSGFFRGPADNRTVPDIYPNGFLPNIITELTDYSLALGYRAPINDLWVWDVSVVGAQSKFDFNEFNTVNVSYWFEPLDGVDAANGIFGQSPTSADTGNLIHDETTINLDFRGSTEYGDGKVLNIALGAEWREDNYEIEAGDPVSYQYGRTNNRDIAIFGQAGAIAQPGTQGFPGYSPSEAVDDGRDSVALYADFESNVAEKTLLGAAIRFEDYSDFGTTFTGKLSARFEVSDTTSIRATASTGFRAPGVQQTFFSQRSTNLNSQGVLTDTLTARSDSDVARAFGFESLTEETSVNYSLGLVYRPNQNFTLTLDAYRIDIDDRIVFSSSLGPESGVDCDANPELCPIKNILDPLGVGQIQFFTNAVDTETTGFDLVTSYRKPLDRGIFSFEGILHLNETDVAGINSQSSLLTPDQVFDSTQVTLIEQGQPGERISLAGTYGIGGISATLRANYYGEVTGRGFTGVDHTWSAKTLLDLTVNYEVSDDFIFAIGGTNITDEVPDRWDNAFPFPDLGFNYCWETCPFGLNGGFYFARLSWRLAHR